MLCVMYILKTKETVQTTCVEDHNHKFHYKISYKV